MKLKPLRDQVLLEPLKHEVKKGGIILPDTIHKDRPEQGTVIAVGPGKVEDGKHVAMTVKKGDVVLFSKYGPNTIKIDDKEYLIAKEDDILAIVQ
jgi:chaperonin GroES